MNLTIDDKKVLEAAEKCPRAKTVLQTLFPSVFRNEKTFDFSQVSQPLIAPEQWMRMGMGAASIEVRNGGDNAHYRKSFFLSTSYDWSIEDDGMGYKVLVPRKKY